MAVTEATPHVSLSFSFAWSFTVCFLPLAAWALKELEKDCFYIQCRCLWWVKRGCRVYGCLPLGGKLIQMGSPYTCGRSRPTGVSQSFLNWGIFVADCYCSLQGYSYTQKATALLPHCFLHMRHFMVRYSSTTTFSSHQFENGEQDCWTVSDWMGVIGLLSVT